MQIFDNLNEIKSIEETSIALGNFDGVHLGHQKLIRETIEIAKERGITLGTFFQMYLR